MTGSKRRKQRKAEAQKRQERKRAEKARKKARVHKILADARKNAEEYKRILRDRGCDWKFYEDLDSYTDAFARESAAAARGCFSLLGVFEVDNATYEDADRESIARRLGFAGLRQLFFDAADVGDEYLHGEDRSNVTGCTIAFRDDKNNLKTLILLREKAFTAGGAEIKCACKLIAVFHEMGHAVDWEQGINLREGQVAMLDAETHAHLYALKRLLAGDYRKALAICLAAFDEMLKTNDYRKTVAQRILAADLAAQCRLHAAESWDRFI